MTARGNLIDRLLDVVSETDLDDPAEDFLAVTMSLLGLALSKLPPDEREQYLTEIEDGTLRRVVGMYPNTRQPWPSSISGDALQ